MNTLLVPAYPPIDPAEPFANEPYWGDDEPETIVCPVHGLQVACGDVENGGCPECSAAFRAELVDLEPEPEPVEPIIPAWVMGEAENILKALSPKEWPDDEIYNVATGFDLYVFVEGQGEARVNRAYLYPLGRNDAIAQLRPLP